MEENQQWITKVTEKIRNSPLAANFCFGVILFSFEKIVQIEFACPCNSQWNLWIASVFFIVPALIVFLLMCVIRKCKCKVSFCEDFCYSSFPAITWMTIVFLDGRYYTCARTPWSGKYETIDGAEPHRWCKPSGNYSEEFLSQTQGWYSQSQVRNHLMFLKFAQ